MLNEGMRFRRGFELYYSLVCSFGLIDSEVGVLLI